MPGSDVTSGPALPVPQAGELKIASPSACQVRTHSTCADDALLTHTSAQSTPSPALECPWRSAVPECDGGVWWCSQAGAWCQDQREPPEARSYSSLT